jgi:hypothetical protein
MVIFAVVFLLAAKNAASAAVDDEWSETKTVVDETDVLFPSDRPIFSTDVEFYLGQKQRRRGNGGGRVWANLYYANTMLKPKNAGYKIKPELYGLQFGLDFVQSHGVYTTLFGNVNRSSERLGAWAKAKSENYLFGVGRYLYLSGCHFGGIYSIGYDQYKVNNHFNNINSNGDGLQMNLFGEFGVDFLLGTWAIKPFYALQYDFLYHGRIGKPDINVPESVFQNDWNGHGLVQLLGTRINWKPIESLELQSRFTWVHEMLDHTPAYYHARFSAVQGTMTPAVFYYQGNTGRDWAWIGLGLKSEPVYNVFLFLDYDLTINSRHATHLANLGFCLGW